MGKRRGHYLGTEIDENWRKRYRKDGFFARGVGRFWLDDEGFYFHKYLTRKPIVIPLMDVQEVKLGTWHSGRKCPEDSVVKILWKKEGTLLSSGVRVRARLDAMNLKSELEARMKRLRRGNG
jgi:hypothetical protein